MCGDRIYEHAKNAGFLEGPVFADLMEAYATVPSSADIIVGVCPFVCLSGFNFSCALFCVASHGADATRRSARAPICLLAAACCICCRRYSKKKRSRDR